MASFEEPGERLIIHREGSLVAFLILDFLPGSFTTDAAQLVAGKTEHWGGSKEWLDKGGHLETIDRRKLPIDVREASL